MLELPMPIRLQLDAKLQIDTPFGSGTLTLKAPVDRDKDGDPEIELHVDLPGRALDQTVNVELPFSSLLEGPLELAAQVLEKTDDFPLKTDIIAILRGIGEGG